MARVPVKTKQDVIFEFRTSGILEAARAVFARKGFHDATVDEIAETAGVAKGTVYLYYPSKRDIYFAALKFDIGQMYSILIEDIKRESSTEGKLKALIAAKLTYFDANRDFFKIYYSELGNFPTHPAGIDSELKSLYLDQARLVESILKEGVRKKVIRALRTEQAALAISDIIRGVITYRILGWSRTKTAQDADFIFDMIWKGIAVS